MKRLAQLREGQAEMRKRRLPTYIQSTARYRRDERGLTRMVATVERMQTDSEAEREVTERYSIPSTWLALEDALQRFSRIRHQGGGTAASLSNPWSWARYRHH